MNRSSWFLLILGLTAMVADISGLKPLKGIALATAASPAPKVFGSVNGLETFSSQFTLTQSQENGPDVSITLSKDHYSKLKGPYNRRNVYGAVLAYGPLLPSSLRDPVIRYGFCGRAPLLSEMGMQVNPSSDPLLLKIIPKKQVPHLQTTFQVGCP